MYKVVTLVAPLLLDLGQGRDLPWWTVWHKKGTSSRTVAKMKRL